MSGQLAITPCPNAALSGQEATRRSFLQVETYHPQFHSEQQPDLFIVRMSSVDPEIIHALLWLLVIVVGFILATRLQHPLIKAYHSLLYGGAIIGLSFMFVLGLYQVRHQFGAKDRLEALGVSLFPGINHAKNASGGRAPRYVWLLDVTGNKTAVREYYLDQANRGDWNVEADKSAGIILVSKRGRLLIEYLQQSTEFELGITFKPIQTAGESGARSQGP